MLTRLVLYITVLLLAAMSPQVGQDRTFRLRGLGPHRGDRTRKIEQAEFAAFTAASRDALQYLPPGQRLCRTAMKSVGDRGEIHEGTRIVRIFYEKFAPTGTGFAAAVRRAATLEPNELPFVRVLTLVYKNGRFETEWHLTRAAGRDIPPGKQVKHYLP